MKTQNKNNMLQLFALGLVFVLAMVLDFIALTSLSPIEAQSLSSNSIAPAPPPSYYEGIVEAITNNPSSITFTSGLHYQGNLSKVRNLSIGSVCNLTINNTGFSGGSCKAGT